MSASGSSRKLRKQVCNGAAANATLLTRGQTRADASGRPCYSGGSLSLCEANCQRDLSQSAISLPAGCPTRQRTRPRRPSPRHIRQLRGSDRVSAPAANAPPSRMRSVRDMWRARSGAHAPQLPASLLTSSSSRTDTSAAITASPRKVAAAWEGGGGPALFLLLFTANYQRAVSETRRNPGAMVPGPT